MLELITLLNPKNNRFHLAGAGSADALSWTDIAAALSWPRMEAGRKVYLSRLEFAWAVHLVAQGSEEGWQFEELIRGVAELLEKAIKPTERVSSRRLAMLVVVKSVKEHSCAKCGGQGYRLEHGRSVRCGKCHGTGMAGLSGRQCAEQLGVDESTWRERYREPVRRASACLDLCHSNAYRHVLSTLGREQIAA